MKKVLVPTDFSENAAHSLHYAAQLSARMGAELVIMHANTAAAYALPVSEYYGSTVAEAEAHEEVAIKELSGIIAGLRERWPGVTARTAIAEGGAVQSVVNTADEEKADLIVMGTKGAAGMTEYLVGSNTERVVRTAHVPVLAVPAVSGDFKMQNVVLSTTLKDDQSAAFAEVAKLQKLFDFKLFVLYLNDPSHLGSDEAIDERLDTFVKAHGLKNVSLFSSGSSFNEEKSILEFAAQSDADLLVMATHQRQGLSHLIFGSLTEDAINHAKMPVLAVPIV